jgi:DMSO/TMAO reductase YedYZ molybdopterin-dependent catalytic subunit
VTDAPTKPRAPSDAPLPTDARERPARALLGLAGAAAAAFTLGFGALVAAVYEEPSSIDNVATAIIDNAPGWFVDLGIELFGTNDKLALGVGVVVVTIALGGWVGRASWSRAWLVWLVYGVFAAIGFAAALDRPDASAVSAFMILLISGLAGVGVHFVLLRVLRRETSRSGAQRDQVRAADRRLFLGFVGGVAVAAAGSALWARAIVRQVAVSARNAIRLPAPREPARPVPDAASFDVPGITPIVTPNDDFYRIDTAFVTPRVDASDWSLSVRGFVERPYSVGYDELVAMPMVERYVTLACVSNEVGGSLIGNAKWLGVPLADILDRAGPTDRAEQVVGRSVDGFTAGFPIELAHDGRDALVAVGMNDEPLPFEHGFPARLVVEGIYGYVSATKWLSEIELTSWDFDGFWVPRGWAKEGPVKTQSRIDVPGRGEVPAGRTVVAGVAWAQNRGIERVEVRVDGGDWIECELAAPISDGTWRQWRAVVELDPGEHVIEARATDATGTPQSAEYRPPQPDGATGYPVRTIDVL